jgi:hypothetical protein
VCKKCVRSKKCVRRVRGRCGAASFSSMCSAQCSVLSSAQCSLIPWSFWISQSLVGLNVCIGLLPRYTRPPGSFIIVANTHAAAGTLPGFSSELLQLHQPRPHINILLILSTSLSNCPVFCPVFCPILTKLPLCSHRAIHELTRQCAPTANHPCLSFSAF